jgi:hypothetical protein
VSHARIWSTPSTSAIAAGILPVVRSDPQRLLRGFGKLVVVVLAAGLAGTGLGIALAELPGNEDSTAPALPAVASATTERIDRAVDANGGDAHDHRQTGATHDRHTNAHGSGTEHALPGPAGTGALRASAPRHGRGGSRHRADSRDQPRPASAGGPGADAAHRQRRDCSRLRRRGRSASAAEKPRRRVERDERAAIHHLSRSGRAIDRRAPCAAADRQPQLRVEACFLTLGLTLMVRP